MPNKIINLSYDKYDYSKKEITVHTNTVKKMVRKCMNHLKKKEYEFSKYDIERHLDNCSPKNLFDVLIYINMVDIDIVVNACLQFNFRFVISLYLVVYCRAARTILTHELSCKLDNRLDALAGTFKFFSGYYRVRDKGRQKPVLSL